jgi:PAS domain S-box-containing protein
MRFENNTKKELIKELKELGKKVNKLKKTKIERNHEEKRILEALHFAENIVATVHEPLLVLDAELKVILANRSFYSTFKVTPEETKGQLIYNLGNHQWNIPKLREFLTKILPKNTSFDNYEVQHYFETIGQRTMLLNARQIHQEADNSQMILLAIEDITERTQIERDRYRLLLESITDGVLVADRELRYILVNDKLSYIARMPKEKLLGRRMIDLFPGIEETVFFRTYRQVLETGTPATAIDEFTFPDGRKNWLEVHTYPAPEGLLVIVTDITERRQAEQKLRFLSSTVEQSSEGMAIADLKGNLMYVNQAWVKMHGYESPKELIGQHLSIFHNQAQLENDVIPFNQKAMQKGYHRGEVGHMRRDGTTFPTQMTTTSIKDKNGKNVAICGLALDITEHKQAEKRIEHLNRVLRAIRNVNQLITKEKNLDRLLKGACENLIETAGYFNAWIVLLDESGKYVTHAEMGLGKDFLPMIDLFKNGKIVDCGKNALSQSGMIVTETPADTCTDCPLSGKYADRAAMTIRLEYMGKTLGLIAVSISKEFINDEQEYSLFKEVAADIAFALHGIEAENLRKQAEQDLNKYREHLEELVEARTSDIASFSYSVSHDLRAPLRAINGFSNILFEEYSSKLDLEGKRVLNIIQSNTRKMAQLIDDLLKFSRIGQQELSFAKVDMQQLAKEIFNEQKSFAPEREIKCSISALPRAFADRALIREVLANYISNAIKFTSLRREAIVKMDAKKEKDKIIYSISDNGVGFDMKYKDKLFMVFQRLHSSEEFEGTGVGLAIAKRIIDKHGGQVWAEGKADKGATFHFSLPRIREFSEKE